MVNDLTLIGHICANIELKHLENGTPVCSVSLATNKTWKDANGEKQEDTQFHNLVFWRANAENAANWLKKGSLIYVKGEISYRDYEKDGVKRYQTDITVLTFRKLEKSDKASENFPTTEQQAQKQAQIAETPKEDTAFEFPNEPIQKRTYGGGDIYEILEGVNAGKKMEIKSIIGGFVNITIDGNAAPAIDESTFEKNLSKLKMLDSLPF